MKERSLQNAFFLFLLVLTTAAFFGLIQDFLMPIFWAAVLATIFHPLYRWCRHRLGGAANTASVGTIVLIVVMVLVPLLLTGMAVATEATTLYNRLNTGEWNPQAIVDWVDANLPAVVDLLSRFGLTTDELQRQLSSAAVGTSRLVATEAVAVGQNTLRIGGLVFIMLYLLFFFLRDGTKLVDTIIGAAPIGDVRERRLLRKFAEVTRATLKGTIVIGIVQGGIGGLLFWLLGIDGAVLWGVVMGFLSLLPAVGAALVWIPAAVILLLIGEVLRGILLLIFGTVLIGLADNVLRPILVGRDTQMPDYLILVSTLGGITLFGVSGVIIGPVLASLFLAVWTMFIEEYSGAASDGGVFAEQSPSAPPAADNAASAE
jgi:predicted PurR-regulated permease PerM